MLRIRFSSNYGGWLTKAMPKAKALVEFQRAIGIVGFHSWVALIDGDGRILALVGGGINALSNWRSNPGTIR